MGNPKKVSVRFRHFITYDVTGLFLPWLFSDSLDENFLRELTVFALRCIFAETELY
jgi:hypothetical protein